MTFTKLIMVLNVIAFTINLFFFILGPREQINVVILMIGALSSLMSLMAATLAAEKRNGKV